MEVIKAVLVECSLSSFASNHTSHRQD